MNANETPQDRPEPRQAGGAHTERRYTRRIDCAERPRPSQSVEPAVQPPSRRDDTHR
jgi:hypothetical protein